MYSRRSAWIVLMELTLYGFLIRIGQLGVILLALQFSQIFTNPAQIIFLFPIAISTLIILGLLALVEIECSRYVSALDTRLYAINSYTNQFNLNGQRNYLEKSILPITLNILALPVILVFLAWTTPYLFSILLLSTILSCLLILKFNHDLKQQFEVNQEACMESRGEEEKRETIPLYLLRNFDHAPNIYDKELISKQESLNYRSTLLKTRKRRFLSLIRKSTRVIILVAAVTLAVLNITSIAKIAGFLIIGNVFRNGCTAIVEYMSSTDEIIPLEKTINLLCEALTETEDLATRFLNIQQYALQKRQNFNEKYASLICNHPYLRFKNLTIKDIDGLSIASNISARVLVDPITIITIPGNKIASRVKTLIENKISKSPKALDRYIFSGDIFLSRQRLTHQFFQDISIHNPDNIFVASLNVLDYFDDLEMLQVKELLAQEKEIEALLDSIINPGMSIEMHNSKQINQFRSILQLLIIYTQPECLSLVSFGLDYFEASDFKTLLRIFRPLYKLRSINLLVMSRYTLPANSECLCYQFAPGELLKV